MAEVSNYSWLAQAFANLEDPEEDFFSVFGTPEQMDLYSAAITDDEILTAAWQFQQAGSHNSTDEFYDALGATENLILQNPHGQPLPLERLLQIAEEYPAITVSGDLLSNDQTTITEAIELSNTDSFADNIGTIIEDANNQDIDLISAATTPETSTFAERLAALAATLPSAKEGGEELFDEGAYISPMATSTFELDGEPVAGAFGTPDDMGFSYQEVLSAIKAENELAKTTAQANAEIAATNTITAGTADKLENDTANANANIFGSQLFRTFANLQNDPYDFADYLTDINNYDNNGLSPEQVYSFLGAFEKPAIAANMITQNEFDELEKEYQSFATKNFSQDPFEGFGTDTNWRPPSQISLEEQRILTQQHNTLLDRYLQTEQGTSEALARAQSAKDWQEAFRLDPNSDLPLGAEKGAEGDLKGLEGYGAPLGTKEYIVPTKRLAGGTIVDVPLEEQQRLWNQNDNIIEMKRGDQFIQTIDPRTGEEKTIKTTTYGDYSATAEEDPEYGMSGYVGGEGISEAARARQAEIAAMPFSIIDPETGERIPNPAREPGYFPTPTGQEGLEAASINIVTDPVTGQLTQQTTPAGTTPAGTTADGTGTVGTGGTGAVETRIDPMTGLPAAPIGEGQTFGSFAGGTMSPEQFRQAAALATQQDATTYFTPEQQFMQSAMQATGPTSPLRQALYGAQNPLLQQYYLSGYGSLPQYGGNEEIRGFQDFIGDFSQGRRIGDDSLRSLAEQAARIGAMEDIDYAESLYDPAMSQQELNRRRLYRYTYGTGPQADENRQNLARFLSLQRPGGGVYGGVLGRALGSSVDEMATAYAAMRPDAAQDFLSYYLQQSAGRNNPLMANSGQKPTAQD